MPDLKEGQKTPEIVINNSLIAGIGIKVTAGAIQVEFIELDQQPTRFSLKARSEKYLIPRPRNAHRMILTGLERRNTYSYPFEYITRAGQQQGMDQLPPKIKSMEFNEE